MTMMNLKIEEVRRRILMNMMVMIVVLLIMQILLIQRIYSQELPKAEVKNRYNLFE